MTFSKILFNVSVLKCFRFDKCQNNLSSEYVAIFTVINVLRIHGMLVKQNKFYKERNCGYLSKWIEKQNNIFYVDLTDMPAQQLPFTVAPVSDSSRSKRLI